MKNVLGKSTTDVIKTLAYQYDRRKDQLNTLSEYDKTFLQFSVRNAYADIANEVEFIDNATALAKYGIDLDKYEQTFDFFRRQHLVISSDNNNSPLMPGHLNLLFRAWHDYIHFSYGFHFDFMGEFLTWEKHCEGVSNDKYKKILFSEVVLQSCYFLTFGKFPDVQKVVLLEDEYIDLATELVYFNSPKN